MATVRTGTPQGSSDGSSSVGKDNRRKRKRAAKPKATAIRPVAGINAGLAADVEHLQRRSETLRKWQTVITHDMKEMRIECMNVRRELENLDDVAEAAVEKAERCETQAVHAQERVLKQITVLDESMDEVRKEFTAAQQAMAGELAVMKKKLVHMEKKIVKQAQRSIDEDFLMTQLTALQEQFECSLAKVKEEHAAELLAKHQELMGMQKLMETARDESARVLQRFAQMPRSAEVEDLRRSLKTAETKRQQEQMRAREQANELEERLAAFDRRVVDARAGPPPSTHDSDHSRGRELEALRQSLGDMEHARQGDVVYMRGMMKDLEDRLVDVGRRMGDARAMGPPLPHDLVHPNDVARMQDDLRHLTRDLRALALDFTELAKRVDARGDQRDQYFEGRLADAGKQIFEVLDNDSRRHATEIRHLKNAVFDVQGDNRDMAQRVHQVEGEVQRMADELRIQPLPPPPPPPPQLPPARCGGFSSWHGGSDRSFRPPEPPFSGPPPLPPGPSRDFRGHSYRHGSSATFGEHIPRRVAWEPRHRSRSRSRSRSPPRRHPRDIDRESYSNRSSQRYDNSNDTSNGPNRGTTSSSTAPPALTAATSVPSPAVVELPRPSGSESQDNGEETATTEPQTEQQVVRVATPAARRIRQQRRRNPEVIIIDEDEDEDEETNTPPNRAPPEVAMDDELGSQLASFAAMTLPAEITDEPVSSDCLERMNDLHTGFLLYFCLGGAPDLETHWTSMFLELKAEDCVVIPRMLGFQRQYRVMMEFPIYLTQCVLQAVIANHQGAEEASASEASNVAAVLNQASLRAEFGKVVRVVRRSWGDALVELLSKQLESEGKSTPELQLSLNPAVLPPANEDMTGLGNEQWRRQQEVAMWELARGLHCGQWLPSLDSIEDVSPAVYLFAVMFDVLTVSGACPQAGTFRLNAFGKKLVVHLWNQLVEKLPYLFFEDWSWLEDQSEPKGKLPVLGFCHLITSILLWNSVVERDTLAGSEAYTDAIEEMFDRLHLDGKPANGSSDEVASFVMVGASGSTSVELLDVDSTFVHILGLDGFFEVMEAIQTRMLASPSLV